MATRTKQSPLEMAVAASPRDTDELEGTLLPPVAVPINESSQVAAAAIPVKAFLYEQHDNMEAQADIPTAPFLPLYENDRDEMEQQALAKGKRRGQIEAESEKQVIGKASRETYAKNYHAKRQVEVANEEAKRRNQEGVHVQQDKYDIKRASNEKKEKEYAFQTTYKGGYDVKEYDTTEYEANDDYDVSEYKSVYDP